MDPTTTRLTVDDAVARLRQLGRQVRSRGRRRWLAQCPAHDDNRHSLSLAEGEEKRLLLTCHAGCTFVEIIAILRGERPPVPLSGGSHNGKRRRSRRPAGPIHWYDYRDERGRLLYQHGRTPDKEFPFRMPGARRGGLQPGVRRVLYRLPALAAAERGDRVFVVEGEKDADRLASLGLLATCNDSGAGKWPEGCDHYFHERHVIILPDNDAPGEAHAQMVAARLAPIAASVNVVTLPELPPKGDVSDWLDAGHTWQELQQRAVMAPCWRPEERRRQREGRRRRKDNERRLSDRSVPACVARTMVARGRIGGRWPKGPAGKLDGFVATIGDARTSLTPIYENNGGYRVDPQQRHHWVLRHGNQVVAEAKAGPVFVACLSEAGYKKFKNRQYYWRRQGQRREWWGVPQMGIGNGLRSRLEIGQALLTALRRGEGCVVVFHNNPAEGGESVPEKRGPLYALIDSLVDGIPNGRNPKGTTDWGRDYRGSRGDGRDQEKERITIRAEALVMVNECLGPEAVAPYRGMGKRTVRQIKAHVPLARRPVLLGMLRDELGGKLRKCVLRLLLRRLLPKALQLWSKDSIRLAATALGARLDPDTRCATIRLAPEEAFRRLAGAPVRLTTRSGGPALTSFLQWLLCDVRIPLWDSEQGIEKRSVQNPIVTPAVGNTREGERRLCPGNRINGAAPRSPQTGANAVIGC